MKHLRVEIEIAAPPAQVWRVLTDFEGYPAWNPYIIELVGQPQVGELLQERVRLPKGQEVSFKSTVLELEAPSKLVWEGYYGARFLFCGLHSLIVEPLADGTKTLFVQTEALSGLMLPFFDMNESLKGYEQMNEALKNRVESEASG